MKDCGIILEVRAEGGRLTIYGIRTKNGWLFSKRVIGQTAGLIDEPLIQPLSASLQEWDPMLHHLDRYPWHRLYPLQVHPEFGKIVFEAVKERFRRDGDGDADPDLCHWNQVCGLGGE